MPLEAPLTLQDYVNGVSDLVTQRQMLVAAVTLLIFDWLVTLEKEIRCIWRSGSSVTKYIFLSNRYFLSLVTVFALYAWSGTATFFTPKSCKIWLGFDMVLELVIFINLHLLVTLRAWALWAKTRPTAVLIWGVFGGYLILQLVTVLVTVTKVHVIFRDVPGIQVCVARLLTTTWMLWLPGVLYEIFLFVLTVTKALEHARTGVGGEFLSVTYRDAFFFFMFITFNGCINLLFWAVARPTQALVFKYFSAAVCQTTGGHLILNLIEAGNKTRHHQQQQPNADEQSLSAPNHTTITTLANEDNFIDTMYFNTPTVGTVTFGTTVQTMSRGRLSIGIPPTPRTPRTPRSRAGAGRSLRWI